MKPLSPLFINISRAVTVQDALFVLTLLVVAGVVFLVLSPKQEDKAARTSGSGLRWFARLFESEGEPSIRLVLAAVVTAFVLSMLSANRLNDMQLESLLTFVGTLLLIGSARIAATAFANRPVVPATQIKADKVEASAEGDNIINQNTAS